MTKDNTNPFVLPGFGQSGDAAQNPLIASMEMMRSAWEGLAKVGGFEQVLGSNVSAQDLEKRIADLRAVEQWLRMNLSMLSSTIQALEVQQATVSTLNSFLSTVSTTTNDSSVPPSPLEVALGIRPDTQTKQTSAQTSADNQGTEKPQPQAKAQADKQPASGDSTGLFSNPTETIQQANEAVQAAQQAQIEQATQASKAAEDATKRWWGLLQNQFDTLAQAATATVQSVNQTTTPTKTATKAAPKKASSKKTTLKKTAVKKAATKKATTKATATKKAASKKATKKSTAKNAASKTSTKA